MLLQQIYLQASSGAPQKKAIQSSRTTPFPVTTGVQYFSASRTRGRALKTDSFGREPSRLYTNTSLPLFTLAEDTTTGIHDTLFGRCDRFRYHNLGIEGYEQSSCAENMHTALHKAAAAGLFPPCTISTEWTPDPLNVFMNVPNTTALDRRSGGVKSSVSHQRASLPSTLSSDLRWNALLSCRYAPMTSG